MTVHHVTATRWRLGWEISYLGETVTQSDTFDGVAQQFIGWFETVNGAPPDGEIVVSCG